MAFWIPGVSSRSTHLFFLDAFLFTLKKDRNFITSLKRRYAFFKEALEDDPSLIKIFPEEEFPENVVPLKSFKGR